MVTGNELCADVRPLLFASLEGGCTAEERARLTAHLATCEDCRQERDVERALTTLLRAGGRAARRPRGRRLRILAAAAASVALLGLVPVLLLQPKAYGSIRSATLAPRLAWQDGGEELLRESNHVEIPAGTRAVVEIDGTASVRAVGPAAFELDRAGGAWKVTLHHGQLTVTVLAGREVVLAGEWGVQTLGEGEHVVSPSLLADAAGRSAAELLARGLNEFFQQFDHASAARDLADAAAHPEATAEVRSQALFYLIAAHANLDRHAEVVATASSWLEEFPEEALGNVSARFWLGEALIQLGRREEGFALFDALMEEQPKNPYAPYVELYRSGSLPAGVPAEDADEPAPQGERGADAAAPPEVYVAAAPAAEPGAEYLVVAAALDPANAEHRAFRELAGRVARFHGAPLVDFDGEDFDGLRAVLLKHRPARVAVVVPPEAFDVNLHRGILSRCGDLDGDPFPDFELGYLTARDSGALAALWERTLALHRDGLAARRWVESSVVGSGLASYTGGRESLPEYARAAGFDGESLHFGVVEADPDVLQFADEHLDALEGAGVIGLWGNGDPLGVWLFDGGRNLDSSAHWPFDPELVGHDPEGEMPHLEAARFRALELGGAVVWSGTCHSGATRRVLVEGDIVSTFGDTGGTVRLYELDPDESLCLALLDGGAGALLVPIGANHGWSALNEMSFAVQHGASLGAAVKSTYDDVFLHAGGVPRLVISAPGEAEHFHGEHVMRGGGINRALIGDPALTLFEATDHPLEKIAVEPRPDGGFDVTVRWASGFHPFHWNLFGDPGAPDSRVVARVPLRALAAADEALDYSVTSALTGPEGAALEHALLAAIEEHAGERVLHLEAAYAADRFRRDPVEALFRVRPRGARTEEPTVVWTTPVDAASYGSAAAADLDGDGRREVLFGTYFGDGHVYCLDAATGELRWKRPSEGGPRDASVLIAELDGSPGLEALSADSASGRLECLGPDGESRWTVRLPSGTDSPPAAGDLDGDGTIEVVVGTMKVRGGEGRVVALEGMDGATRWWVPAPGHVQSEPALCDLNGDGVLDVLVTSWDGDGRLRALDGRDGAELWSFDAGDWIYHGPSVADLDGADGLEVVVADRRGTVWMLEGATGRERWRARLEGEREGSVFAPTSLVDADGDGRLEIVVCGLGVHVLDAEGDVQWEAPQSATSIERGAAVGDVDGDGRADLVFGAGTRLRALRALDGRAVFDVELGSGDPEESIGQAPLLLDAAGDGGLDVFVVVGRARYDDQDANHGRALLLRTPRGRATEGQNEWLTFRGGPRRSGRKE